jgi:hypothetical protein
MADRRLTEAFRSVAEAFLPDTVLTQERAVGGALNDDSTVRPDAITAALPWQRLDFRLPGVVTTGTSLGGIYKLPQGGTIRHISAHARVAPTTGPFTGRLVVNGVVEDSGSIQPGATSITSSAIIPVPPGGIVTLNVTSAGNAEDVTVSVFHSAGGTT